MSGKWQKAIRTPKSSKSNDALISAGSDSPTSCAISSCSTSHANADPAPPTVHAMQTETTDTLFSILNLQ